MKRTVFLGLAVLLVLAVFSCGDFSVPVGGGGDEQSGITLGVSDIAGRSLTGPLAEAGTNYYEATFQRADGRIYRTTWSYARKGKIQLEPATYTVILMAGRRDDSTLLGVGKATAITGGGTVNTGDLDVTIIATTSDIAFSVYPLLNNITSTGTDGNGIPADPGEFGVSDSTFTTAVSNETVTYPLPTTKDELGNTVPVFVITRGGTTVATWTYTIGTTDQIALFAEYLLLAADPGIYQTGFSFADSYDVPQKLTNISITAPATVGDPITTTSGIVAISATAPNGDGMVQVALDVPVIAIEIPIVGSLDKPITWYIRGGLNNGAIDAGTTPNFAQPGRIGGALVLGFGDLSTFPVITLTPGWAP
jgi:hypothetical protein